ncbi:MAG: HEAT repeat domain-containing protein [Chloroflexi bacterium]|nr:HEAT repeat domain-containing protein [Chloroflexota bacterium]
MADEQLLALAVEMLDRPGDLEPELIGALSHLVRTDLEAVAQAWRGLPIERRLELLTQLGRSERQHAQQDFNAIYGMALSDDEGRVRRLAVDSIVTENGPALLDRLTEMAESDPDPYAREAAVARLGPFALMAELGELPAPWADRLRTLLLAIHNDASAPIGVRREALASVGYLDSVKVESAIEEGFEEPAFQLWAMRAMGRTANVDWLDTLIGEAAHPDPAVRQEVARALGELADEQAAPTVAELVDDTELEVQLAAIKSLGQIGGDEAREALIYALEDERDIIREAAENALNEIEETEDPLSL